MAVCYYYYYCCESEEEVVVQCALNTKYRSDFSMQNKEWRVKTYRKYQLVSLWWRMNAIWEKSNNTIHADRNKIVTRGDIILLLLLVFILGMVQTILLRCPGSFLSGHPQPDRNIMLSTCVHFCLALIRSCCLVGPRHAVINRYIMCYYYYCGRRLAVGLV